MAAGTSSRFVPLSVEYPKGLLEVKGEILIERQIRQLKEAGIDDIIVVVGYLAEKFLYLKEKFGIDIVVNEDFDKYNNISSLIRVIDKLGNTYICSSDNYFPENIFIGNPSKSYYSALYAEGDTNEYCIQPDENEDIANVTVGGHDSWFMVGHAYFSDDFSKAFAEILKKEYENEKTRYGYWEDLYIRYINSLPKISMRKYSVGDIIEFDSLDELRLFDKSYINNTRSSVIKRLAAKLGCEECALSSFKKLPSGDFTFLKGTERFSYLRSEDIIQAL